jgi:hypothetical protein
MALQARIKQLVGRSILVRRAATRSLFYFRTIRASKHTRVPWAPGDYYSPIPDLRDVRAHEPEIFRSNSPLYGVELHPEEQLELVLQLAMYYATQPFSESRQTGLRYWFDNDQFRAGDALVFYGLLRHLRPRRLIEVGSGFSSALMLDVRDRFLGGELHCTFIEPYPARLYDLLADGDDESTNVLVGKVQDVDPHVFSELQAGDVLFIDSSHVSKVGSDVNRLLFDILPTLNRGVYVHFHDIFYPFEYPPDWIYEGRAWNEAYLIHSFLLYNEAFRIVLFNSFLGARHRSAVAELMPLWATDTGGSLWLMRQ